MAGVTGTPVGTIVSSEDIYIDSAPYIYIQDYSAGPWYDPDADGFYWQLSGTSTYNVYEIGCPSDVSFSENLTINDVLCDNVGVKVTIQQRNYLQLNFTMKAFFPLSTLRILLKGGAVTETPPTDKFGFGDVNNNQFWQVYCPRVYDDTAGDYVWLHLHKCQFVDAFTVNMPFGDQWNVAVSLRAFADTSKPSAQRFGVFGRSDASVIT